MQIPDGDPTRLHLPDLKGAALDALRESLTYTDQRALYQYQNFRRKGGWFALKYGQEAYEARLAELKEASRRCLLHDEGGRLWTYSGLRGHLAPRFGQTNVQVRYPEPRLLAWQQPPRYQMYPYQREAMERLLAAKHAGVQLGTGLGKSFIITNLIKELGLRTLVMTPSTSISQQLYDGDDGFLKLFGRQKVGAFFDGKKEYRKLVTVGNAQSLTRVPEGGPAWEALRQTQVFVADESHLCPAETLAKVCFGLAAPAPYRFFFSATQMRTDGLDLLLDAITGPIVYNMTVRQGVDGGYLAKPVFRMFRVRMTEDFRSDDANAMTRAHLFYNPRVVAAVGGLVNAAVAAGMPALVLVEEVEQFTRLLPYLRYPAGFAHGPLSDDRVVNGRVVEAGNRKKVPPEYWDSDPNALVAEFNAGRLPILVGTSCISTGTDVRAVKFLVYWQGGKSEIQVRQAVGRGTRLAPGKTSCHVVDFDVWDPHDRKEGVLHRHADVRRQIYDDLYGPVREAEL